jgi:cytochrome c2
MIIFAFQYKTIFGTEQPTELAPVCIEIPKYPNSPESVKYGRKLARQLCASCHKLDKPFLGPALGAIGERHDTLSLYQFIWDEDAFRKVSNEFPLDTTMDHSHNFKQLSKEDINAILEYTWVVNFK